MYKTLGLCLMCLDASVQPLATCDDSEPDDIDVLSQQDTDKPLSPHHDRHDIGSCQPHNCDNATATDNTLSTDLPSPPSSSASLATHPGQLKLVPIVYVNADGLPVCYEVVEPVPSPSCLTRSSPRLSSSHHSGL